MTMGVNESALNLMPIEIKRSTVTAEFAAMVLKVAKEYWQMAKYNINYAIGQYKADMKREKSDSKNFKFLSRILLC